MNGLQERQNHDTNDVKTDGQRGSLNDSHHMTVREKKVSKLNSLMSDYDEYFPGFFAALMRIMQHEQCESPGNRATKHTKGDEKQK